MATFSGEATVMVNLASDGEESAVRRHAARAQVRAAGDADNPATNSSNQSFEMEAGASIRVAWAFRAASTLGTPNAGDIAVYVALFDDNSGVVLRQMQVLSLAGGFPLAVQTNGAETFFATTTGLAGGTPKAGTYRIRVEMDYAQVTADAVNGGYLSNSDGGYVLTATPNTWNAAVRVADKGYIRAGMDLTAIAVSNTLGGATPSPFAYPDKIRLRVTSSAQALANSSSLVIDADTLTAADALARDLQVTASTSSTTWDDNNVHAQFDATDPATFGVQIGQPANSTLSLRPWTHFESVPAGWTLGATDGGVQTTKSVLAKRSAAFTWNKAITVAHLMQVNEDDFATPPLSLDQTTRLTSDLAFLSARFRNARGEGQNGITATLKIWDTAGLTGTEGSPVASTSQDTGTQGGEAGWLDTAGGKLPLTWDEALPGGSWTTKAVITAPAAAVGLETNASRTMTLLTVNPSIQVRAYLNLITDQDRHWSASADIRVNAYLLNTDTGVRLDPDAGTFKVGLVRYDATTMALEQLISDIDDTSAAWVTWLPGDALTFFTLAADPGDARLFFRDFTATGGWTRDVTCTFLAAIGGTPYSGQISREITGDKNAHDKYSFDGAGFAGFPQK